MNKISRRLLSPICLLINSKLVRSNKVYDRLDEVKITKYLLTEEDKELLNYLANRSEWYELKEFQNKVSSDKTISEALKYKSHYIPPPSFHHPTYDPKIDDYGYGDYRFPPVNGGYDFCTLTSAQCREVLFNEANIDIDTVDLETSELIGRKVRNRMIYSGGGDLWRIIQVTLVVEWCNKTRLSKGLHSNYYSKIDQLDKEEKYYFYTNDPYKKFNYLELNLNNPTKWALPLRKKELDAWREVTQQLPTLGQDSNDEIDVKSNYPAEKWLEHPYKQAPLKIEQADWYRLERELAFRTEVDEENKERTRDSSRHDRVLEKNKYKQLDEIFEKNKDNKILEHIVKNESDSELLSGNINVIHLPSWIDIDHKAYLIRRLLAYTRDKIKGIVNPDGYFPSDPKDVLRKRKYNPERDSKEELEDEEAAWPTSLLRRHSGVSYWEALASKSSSEGSEIDPAAPPIIIKEQQLISNWKKQNKNQPVPKELIGWIPDPRDTGNESSLKTWKYAPWRDWKGVGIELADFGNDLDEKKRRDLEEILVNKLFTIVKKNEDTKKMDFSKRRDKIESENEDVDAFLKTKPQIMALSRYEELIERHQKRLEFAEQGVHVVAPFINEYDQIDCKVVAVLPIEPTIDAIPLLVEACIRLRIKLPKWIIKHIVEYYEKLKKTIDDYQENGSIEHDNAKYDNSGEDEKDYPKTLDIDQYNSMLSVKNKNKKNANPFKAPDNVRKRIFQLFKEFDQQNRGKK